VAPVTAKERTSDAARLERLWTGEFGDAWVGRNLRAGAERGPFWDETIDFTSARTVLEVGCGFGANLRWLLAALPGGRVSGVDVNALALDQARTAAPTATLLRAAARALPFQRHAFDLVLTVAVLIHQPDESLPSVVDELGRCSRRWVMCGEYFAPEPTAVEWRGTRDALIKRDYGRILQEQLPGFRLVREQFFPRDTGWDDVTFWLLEKR
jgi:pseudaminic acid biosynthesis-associated methylase